MKKRALVFAGLAAGVLAGCSSEPTYDVKGEQAIVTKATVSLQQKTWQAQGSERSFVWNASDVREVFDFAAQTRCLISESNSLRAADVLLGCKSFAELDKAGKDRVLDAVTEYAKGPGTYYREFSRAEVK